MLFKTYLTSLLGLVIFVFRLIFVAAQKGCLLNVTNQTTEKFLPVPLYNLSSYYELVVPYQGAIQLKQGEKLSLLCAGPRNYLTLTNSNITSVSCVHMNIVQIFNNKTDFEKIQCKKTSKGEVRKTEDKCGNNRGYLYKIGYQVTRKDWLTLIHVCHVPEIGNTLYTEHIIHGKTMKYASKSTNRPGFSTSGLNDNVTASVAYKRPYQKAIFNDILKSAKRAETYINATSYLARGHLSPHADFLLTTSQYSTYYYINTAPQWQIINGGSWKSIESTVRKLSEPYENLQIITGTHGVLTYQDASGATEPVFLVTGKKLPAPKYFWKTVYDPESQKAIVFVILNDPFATIIRDSDIFCEDICRKSGYINVAWRKIETGYVFCCEFSSFQNVVDSVPRLRVKGVLGL